MKIDKDILMILEDRESDKANFFAKVPELCSKYSVKCTKLDNDKQGNLFKLTKGVVTTTLDLYGHADLFINDSTYKTIDELKDYVLNPAQDLIACLNEIPFLK